jgi:DNA-binding PadR family transcriptional regulator
VAKKSRPHNPLALAVLALLFERPMHPYEMAATLKRRHKEESIKLRFGSLYTVIELLLARGLVRAGEPSREGKRPERTVYALTDAGRDELIDWMRDLLREPVKEYPQFEAALSLMPVLPPEEAIALLRDRALRLAGEAARLETSLAAVAELPWPAVAGAHQLPPALLKQPRFPPLFTVEAEYRLAMVRAEQSFVTELIRRFVDDGWGPVDFWRDLQTACAAQHDTSEEALD